MYRMAQLRVMYIIEKAIVLLGQYQRNISINTRH